jgi:hypothetical protein
MLGGMLEDGELGEDGGGGLFEEHPARTSATAASSADTRRPARTLPCVSSPGSRKTLLMDISPGLNDPALFLGGIQKRGQRPEV